MPLFAEGPPETWLAVVATLIAFVTGGGLMKFYKEWRTTKKEDRRDALSEWKEIADRQDRTIKGLQADRDSDREVIHMLRGEVGILKNRIFVCERDREQLHLELNDIRDAAEKAGIEIPRRPPASGRYLPPPPDGESALD